MVYFKHKNGQRGIILKDSNGKKYTFGDLAVGKFKTIRIVMNRLTLSVDYNSLSLAQIAFVDTAGNYIQSKDTPTTWTAVNKPIAQATPIDPPYGFNYTLKKIGVMTQDVNLEVRMNANTYGQAVANATSGWTLANLFSVTNPYYKNGFGWLGQNLNDNQDFYLDISSDNWDKIVGIIFMPCSFYYTASRRSASTIVQFLDSKGKVMLESSARLNPTLAEGFTFMTTSMKDFEYRFPNPAVTTLLNQIISG